MANTPSLPSGGPDAVQPGKKRGQGSVAREQGPWVGLRRWGPISSGAALTTPFHPQLTLLLVLEDRLHRQLTYDLLPSRLVGGLVVGWGSDSG